MQFRDGGSHLKDLRQSGSMRVVFPRPSSPPTAMIVNTAGGITGGDRFGIDATVGEKARLTVTTQAAERAYRAPVGTYGTVRNTLVAKAGARLNWVPQETILFDGCALNRRLDVTLADSAEALIVEPLVFGRAAHGEVLRSGHLHDQVRISRAGKLVYADGFKLQGDIAKHLAHPASGGGAGALATLIFVSQNAETQLGAVRSLIDEKTGVLAGASLLSEDLLVFRALAPDSFDLRQLLLPVLDHLTQDGLPICWRL